MVIPIKCDKDNYASVSILNSKTKVKVDKNYTITFNIENKSALNEYNCINSINKKELIISILCSKIYFSNNQSITFL